VFLAKKSSELHKSCFVVDPWNCFRKRGNALAGKYGRAGKQSANCVCCKLKILRIAKGQDQDKDPGL